MADVKGVEAVERALAILDCFDPEAPELSLAEVSKRTGFYKSTILRLAVSLERFGYLVRGETGRFRLGPSAWRIGAAYRQGFHLADVMRPELKALSDATGETASYYVREGDGRVCLFRSEPSRAIRHSITEGARMPLDRGASGKVILAYSGDGGPASAAIRSDGYAVSRGERDPEVAAVAVPVLAESGELLGALAISGLVTRFGADSEAGFAAALFAARERLSKRIAE